MSASLIADFRLLPAACALWVTYARSAMTVMFLLQIQWQLDTVIAYLAPASLSPWWCVYFDVLFSLWVVTKMKKNASDSSNLIGSLGARVLVSL